ncbi:MAG: flavin prenyltransferase UbiX [Clostridia bacterium]
MGKYIIGVTGASGSIYAMRLMEELLSLKQEVFLTITSSGILVLEQELGLRLDGLSEAEVAKKILSYCKKDGLLNYYDEKHIGANIASGSFRTDGMIVVPCSMSTVSAIAHGSSSNLLERAADVMIKERKKLVIVPRETPLSTIHLRNLLSLSEQNVHIVPPMPGFYYHPQKLDDIIDALVGRLLDYLDLEHNLLNRWEGM